MTENHNRSSLGNSAVSASDTGAKPSAGESVGQADPVEWAIALIESETARLRRNDFTALNEVLGTQGLALDAMFTQLTREPAGGHAAGYQALGLALRAQLRSRVTLVTLVSCAKPRPAAQAHSARKDFDEQSAANADSASS